MWRIVVTVVGSLVQPESGKRLLPTPGLFRGRVSLVNDSSGFRSTAHHYKMC